MSGIILDPSILGLEGQMIEVNMAVIKIAGIEVPNGMIASITSVGHSREQSEWVDGLGQKMSDKFTRGLLRPQDMTIRILAHIAIYVKQSISISGKWADTFFSMSLQFQPPASALPGIPALNGLPTMTWTFTDCLLQTSNMSAETAAVYEEWNIRPRKIDTPAGIGT